MHRYDPTRSYDWNYAQRPLADRLPWKPVPGNWSFCGRPISSPLGIAAGPLLNGAWCRYYAQLGFDVLTYKTVRSGARPCYELPNLLPVKTEQLTGREEVVEEALSMSGSWAVSFGMPSKVPSVWTADVRETREKLADDKVLCVSVVGSIQPGWTLDELADDYARCARLAVEAGADAVEANFSCPNVSTCDGQLYQQPTDAGLVAKRIRGSIDSAPLLIKIGYQPHHAQLETLLVALSGTATAVTMTNSIGCKVRLADERFAFDGQTRGICGDATRTESIQQISVAAEMVARLGLDLELIGVGGISTATHAKQYLAAGARSVQLATAVMVDPLVGQKVREQWT